MVKKLVKYLFSNYLSVVLNVFRSFALARILLPESLGAWSLVSTFLGYFRYYNLGFNSLAYYRVGKTGSVELYSSLLIRTNVILTIVFGVIYTVIFGFTQIDQFSTLGYFPIIVAFFVSSIFITQFSETYVAINKIGVNFNTIATYTNILAISGFVFVIVGAMYGGLNGMLIGNLVSSCIGLVYLRKKTVITKFRPKLYYQRLKVFFIRSSKMIVPSLLSIAYTSSDIWMINYRFSLKENGYFSLIQTFITVLLILPSSVAVFYYSNNAKNMIKNEMQVYKLTGINFVLTAVLVGISYIIMSLFVKYFAPEYHKSIAIFAVLAVSIPFLCIRNVMVDMLIVKNRLLPLNIAIVILILLKINVLAFVGVDHFYLSIAGLNICYGMVVLVVFILVHYIKPIKNKNR